MANPGKPSKRQDLLHLIESRCAVFPPSFNDQPVAKSEITRLLQVANSAPTHRLTQPWRFKVIMGDARMRLGQWLANQYRSSVETSSFSKLKYEKTLAKPAMSGAVIIICMQRDPAESVPEWEEIAAVACAVQNLWISAGALGLGGYWSSPGSIANMGSFISLAPGERCLGLFYLGHHNQPVLPKKRSPWSQKVTWISD